ncbi:MAG: helix-turn-helix transcriptional regulator [Vicingus serpentipes]|nr:helix-turn-helix transcriptional regulator [Vicingus serpentipes]
MNHQEEQQYLNKLGRRLKQLRTEKGLTQSQCGVDDRTIRRIENDGEIFNPSYLILVEIAEGIGVSLKELVDFD